jgi:molybdopterin-guanine dinucleotide biosynthesis protein A
VYAVITAGGDVSADFARAIGACSKALAPLGERRLIDPAIEAARAIGVAGIAVVGPSQVAAHCADRVDCIVDAAPSGAENIRRALRAFADAERLVFLTSDLPFIDGPSLAAFVERSRGAALTMALAPSDAYEAEFPGAPMHQVILAGERYANGSAFVIDRCAFAAVERIAGRFFDARKSLPRLALLLGPSLSVRFVVRRLRVRDIEARAQAVLGISARAVRDAAPGLCYDVDDIADWTYAHSLASASAYAG